MLEKEKINDAVYYFKSAGIITTTSTVFALPAFDEYLISYKNRAPVLHSNKKNISVNGIFWPVIIADGKVAGMWSRKIVNDKLHVQPEYFIKPASTIKNELMKSFSAYANFLDKHLTVDAKQRS